MRTCFLATGDTSGGCVLHTSVNHLKVLALILALAFFLRLFFFVMALKRPDISFMDKDSPGYITLAHNLRDAYGPSEKDIPMIHLSLVRTPIYPAFLALCETISNSDYRGALLAQVFLGVIVVLLVFLLALNLFAPEAALMAALVAALDPVSIGYSLMVLTENLFAFLFTAAFVIWWYGLAHRKLIFHALSGLLFGFATLTRPILLYFPLLLLPITLITGFSDRSKRVWKAAALLIAFAVPAGSWMAYNQVRTGSFLLSTIDGVNLLYYRAAGTMAEVDNLPIEYERQRLREQLPDTELSTPADYARLRKEQIDLAMRVLREHPWCAIKVWIKGAWVMVRDTGWIQTLTLAGISVRGHDKPSFIFRLPAALFSIGILYAGVVLGIIMMWVQRARKKLLILLSVLGYFLLISAGPEAYARFRVPIVPLLAVLSGAGWYWTYRRIRPLPSLLTSKGTARSKVSGSLRW